MNFLQKFMKREPIEPEQLGVTPEEINTWILKFLEGAKAEQFITNSTACVKSTENTVSSFVYSIQGYLDDETL